MPVISAVVIPRPRTLQWCAVCNQVLMPGKPRIRVFGNAEWTDPPYVIYVHPECAGEEILDKLPDLQRDEWRKLYCGEFETGER